MLFGKKQQVLTFFLILVLLAAITAGCLWMTKDLEPKDESRSFAVYMTEVLASNSAYPDPEGRCRDFVELYNSADGAIDLSDYKLSDSKQTVKYTFPAGTVIGPGEYLVVWCESGAVDAAPFSVSKEGGETLYLMNGHNVVVDNMTTVPSLRNMSMIPDEAGSWVLSTYATPGFANTADGHEAYLKSRSADSFPVRLSEIVASNDIYPAPDGGLYDYIELHNSTDQPVDLGGCRLSDTEDEAKYTFPTGTVIEPGGYLVVWCGGEGGASFGVAASGGETVCLQSPGGDRIDQVQTLAFAGASYALRDGQWQVLPYATPGYENTELGSEAYLQSRGFGSCTVEISEAMSENRSFLPQPDGTFPDWIELYNHGSESQTLSGYYLADSEESPMKWLLPDVTIEPGRYLVIYCDGKNLVDDAGIHAGFALSRYGETVCLVTPAGTVAASLDVVQTEPDRSVCPDGITDRPTPGYENSAQGWEALQAAQPANPAAVQIWEVMSANSTYYRQSDGSYYDWVELKNTSGQPVSLSGFSLSDDAGEPNQLPLPDVTIQPDQRYTVLLNTGTMGLDAVEYWLYLFHNGKLIDYVHVWNVPYGGSVGRMNGENGFFYFAQPSPEEENSGGMRGISQTPESSLEAGVYEQAEPLTVTLSAPGQIYYTTDGSWPTVEDQPYTQPLTIAATTVLRVMAVEPGCLPSEVETLSYIVNEGHDLPVASLCADPLDIFGGASGIYVHYYADLEKYANLSFFEEGGSFSQDCGLSMFGSMSRETNAKKSFKVLFRPRYEGVLEYDLYKDSPVDVFSSLVLRAGQDYTSAIIREELMTSLADDASDSLLTQKHRYCVLYINGEYFGIYSIKEHFSEDYYAAHAGVSPESVHVLRTTRVADSGTDLYPTMTYASDHDLSQDEHFQYVADRVDLESLADWLIFQTYCGNSDILNNCRYIRSSEGDNKWHYAFYDLDWTFLVHANLTRSSLKGGTQFAMIPRAVLKNPGYRDYFLKRLADQLENTLSAENVIARIEELAGQIRSEVPREREKWGSSVESWEASLNAVKRFILEPGREQEVIDDFCIYLNVTPEEKAAYFGN